jgi:hypothetical protein
VSDGPFAGRRFYFVGIGGAGLSAYANFARAWGADVRGWDLRETIFLEALDGIEVDVGGEPLTPPDFGLGRSFWRSWLRDAARSSSEARTASPRQPR